MEKSKLGISLGLLGAILCVATLFGGYIPAIIIVGYILLKESNAWLKKFSLVVICTLIAFSLLNTVICVFPDFWEWIASLTRVFGFDGFPHAKLMQVTNLFTSGLTNIKTIIFLLLTVYSFLSKKEKVLLFDKQLDKQFN